LTARRAWALGFARESLITPDDLAMDAAESCPAEAIEITDENGALLAPKK
jgi:hypothetical protein